MRPLDEIRYTFDVHSGMMRTYELHEERIHYKDIQSLIKNGCIEKIRYGYYQWIDDENMSEAATVVRLFPDAIMCMDTALFFYRYSDRTPLAWHLAVSKDSGKSRFKIEYPFIKPYYVAPAILDLGVTDATIDGHPIRVYDKERTICDCLRYSGKMDREIFTTAVRRYVEDSAKNIPRLIEYAQKLRVTQKVNAIIGVWI